MLWTILNTLSFNHPRHIPIWPTKLPSWLFSLHLDIFPHFCFPCCFNNFHCSLVIFFLLLFTSIFPYVFMDLLISLVSNKANFRKVPASFSRGINLTTLPILFDKWIQIMSYYVSYSSYFSRVQNFSFVCFNFLCWSYTTVSYVYYYTRH